MKKLIKLTAVIALVHLSLTIASAQQISDYLITSNIGDFIASKNPSSGRGAGMVAGVDHFYQDHADITYRISYFNLQTRVGPEVQVTQHIGADSDRWLPHETDAEFRNYYGIPDNSYAVVPINGNAILEFGSAGWDYRWLSGNKVIKIEYHDAQMTKAEPLDVVKAYLNKHPSTLSKITLSQLRGIDNETRWIKDEMERRLWLCDKWDGQLQLGKATQRDALEGMVKSVNVFLDYREKYFGIKAADEEKTMWVYLRGNDLTNIKGKLAEYKVWWGENKDKAINLP